MEITGEYATDHFKAFVATIYYLIQEKNLKFDLIIGSGNTGILCAKFTELVYKRLNKLIPPILQIPVLRYKGEEKIENLFDNSGLFLEVETFLNNANVKRLENVLFVDDEIYGGNALRAVMQLLNKYKQKYILKDKIICYIVAEDQGVSEEGFSIPHIQTEFYPFAIGIDGASNVITYFMPLELENHIKGVLGNRIGEHTIINIHLGLPIRDKGKNIVKPQFAYTYNQMAAHELPNFFDLQKQAFTLVEKLIDGAISDYKMEKIDLPFHK